MNNKISILGTGWLGFPLAKALINESYSIHGSTTSENKREALKKEGITAFNIDLKEDGPVGDIKSFLDDSSSLIINIPPGLRRNPQSNFVGKIKSLIPEIEKSKVENVLFVSSTSVFSDSLDFPLITKETTPNAISNAGKQLIETEQLLLKNPHFTTTILRFAGLFDARRHPATMLSKRKNIKNPKAPVNLIHLMDCIGIIKKILETNSWNEVFNASYPEHPEKSKYYSSICNQMKLPIPEYDFETPSQGKLILSEKIENHLGYTFTNNLYSL
ncbi:NAD-dependent epimerase/dehydratase family protein [Aquimarina pacifica]|uniref:NAD-dependent epimerase/dehydratase family protein n=1 Tax=Aquimarina pacifica TaxID=1296415 RepID=UPI0004725B1B|nr:NAD-dependent epimerase/dehydratase family protein [Aquimarina pacifica]